MSRYSRLLAVTLALLLHAAVLTPALFSDDRLAGGAGGPVGAGQRMTVSLARAPAPEAPEPAPQEAAAAPESDALKTKKQQVAERPEPEPEPEVEPEPEAEPVTESQASTATAEAAAEHSETDDNVASRAQQQAGDGRPAGEGAHLGGDSDNAWNRYLGELRRTVEQHKTYPRRARMMRAEGRVGVQFHLDDQGRVVKLEVTDSSGHRILDRHVERLLARIELPPPPEGIQVAHRTISLPVDFRVR